MYRCIGRPPCARGPRAARGGSRSDRVGHWQARPDSEARPHSASFTWLLGLSRGPLPAQLSQPRGVAVAPSGHVLVADTDNNRVQVFGPDGAAAGPLQGAQGCGLKHPCGVCVDAAGRVAVADTGRHRVLVFGADGSLELSIGSEGGGPAQLRQPVAVAAHPDGGLAVADSGSHRVLLFDRAGALASSLGGEGSAEGLLRSPLGVAVGAAGGVVVCDSGNHRVQAFRRDGSVALRFGSHGRGPGQLVWPYGVAVDGAGNVVVADRWNHRVQVFCPQGTVLACFGSKGSMLGQFRSPCGVAVDGAGRVLVTDSENHRVQAISWASPLASQSKALCYGEETGRPSKAAPASDRGSGEGAGVSGRAAAGEPAEDDPKVHNPAMEISRAVELRSAQLHVPPIQHGGNQVKSEERAAAMKDRSLRAAPREEEVHPAAAECLGVLTAAYSISDVRVIGKGGWGSVFSAKWGDQSVALKVSALSEPLAADDHLHREADVYLRVSNASSVVSGRRSSHGGCLPETVQTAWSCPREFALRPVTEIFGRTGLARIHAPSGGVYSVLCLPLAQQTACDVVKALSKSFAASPSKQDWLDLKSFTRALLDVVARMHALGVAHRDLKPSNLLLMPCSAAERTSDSQLPTAYSSFVFRGGRFRIYVCDFGLAHVAGIEYRDERRTSEISKATTSRACRDLARAPDKVVGLPKQRPARQSLAASSARAQAIFGNLDLPLELPTAKRQRPGPASCSDTCSVKQARVERVTAQDINNTFGTFNTVLNDALPSYQPHVILRSLGSGTPGYRAPKHRPQGVDGHAYWMAGDVWACGIMLLDVLSAGKMHHMRRADAKLGRDNRGWELLCHATVRLESGRPAPATLVGLLRLPHEDNLNESEDKNQTAGETPVSASSFKGRNWTQALELLGGLMAFDCSARFLAQDALNHPFVSGQ